ncbi:MAG: sugar-binding protein [Planctomycetota bacterium]
MLRYLSVAMALVISVAAGCANNVQPSSDAESAKQPHVAYITNGVASFWTIAESGAKAGGEEIGAKVTVLMPSEGAADQKRMVEDMITKGVDGMAISPIDPENQTDLLNKAAEYTTLITQDSDAPNSKRLAYIGVDNYLAGRMCGELVKEALPNGGKIAIFIGRLEQDNARRRRQGMIDEVLGRDHDPTRFDSPDVAIEAGKWHIVGTYTDQFDRAAGKANAEDAMSLHPDLAGMVGLFVFNPPLILEALKSADRLGEIKVIGFDEADETLQGIKDGYVYGTVVQNPFEYGRQSVKLLAGITRGKSLAELGISDERFLSIPARQIRHDNVNEFWTELKRNLGKQ